MIRFASDTSTISAVADAARIEDLRRRVERDPASIAFAQLAEEYRRIGEFDQAVRVSSRGLILHPDYLAARVTRGRALVALGRLDDAQADLEQVVHAAPDKLAAARALAELHQRRGSSSPAGAADVTVARQESAAIGELESWLAALTADRQRRTRRPSS